MKKNKNIFIFSVILILLTTIKVDAFTYVDAKDEASIYVSKGTYKSTYDKYLITGNMSNYYPNRSNGETFSFGGLISLKEFKITVHEGNNSYLRDDNNSYWTYTGTAVGKKYVISKDKEEEQSEDSDNPGIKVTEFIKDDVKVGGRGTYSNPWYFFEKYNLTIKTDGNGSIMKKTGDSCSGSYSNELSLSYSNGEKIQLCIKANDGYKYYSNTCEEYFTKNDNVLKFNNVNRDLNCEIGFKKIKNELEGVPKVLCKNTSYGNFPYDIEYTGDCELIDDGNEDWRIKFLTSGKLKASTNIKIDAFLVGGGGGGVGGKIYTADGPFSFVGGGSGGGGYSSNTYANIKENKEYEIIIGAGGNTGSKGQNTLAFNSIAYGGNGAVSKAKRNNGSGGVISYEFGQYTTDNSKIYGRNGSISNSNNKNATSAANNTGNGGDGGGPGTWEVNHTSGGKGGSGIVVIRNVREDVSHMPGNDFEFDYDGKYEVINEGNGNWKIRLLTNGTFSTNKEVLIDAFLVGGGGGGSSASVWSNPWGGGFIYYTGNPGGGGYSSTTFSKIQKNKKYPINIGKGGASGKDGGNTTAFSSIAYGGQGGVLGSSGSGGGSISDFEENTTIKYGENGKSAGGCNDGEVVKPNSGNGGYGGGKVSYDYNCGSTGGSSGGDGIVIIRNVRENSSHMPGVAFDFKYDGNYEIINEKNENWKIKILSNGTLSSSKDLNVDVFLVGGGANGTNSSLEFQWDAPAIVHNGKPGGGGYWLTNTFKISKNINYPIVVGKNVTAKGSKEGDTTAFSFTAKGGNISQNNKNGIGGNEVREFEEIDGSVYSGLFTTTGKGRGKNPPPNSGKGGDYGKGGDGANIGNGSGTNGSSGVVIIRNKR